MLMRPPKSGHPSSYTQIITPPSLLSFLEFKFGFLERGRLLTIRLAVQLVLIRMVAQLAPLTKAILSFSSQSCLLSMWLASEPHTY